MHMFRDIVQGTLIVGLDPRRCHDQVPFVRRIFAEKESKQIECAFLGRDHQFYFSESGYCVFHTLASNSVVASTIYRAAASLTLPTGL